MSRESSKPSAAAFVLRRRRSRHATSLWALQLVVLGAAALAIGAPPYVKVLACGVGLVIALVTWPRAPRVLVCAADRGWAVPACRLERMTLGLGTVYTRHWAVLELVGGTSIRREIVWADELDRDTWRRLQLLLREPGAPSVTGDRRPERPGRAA